MCAKTRDATPFENAHRHETQKQFRDTYPALANTKDASITTIHCKLSTVHCPPQPSSHCPLSSAHFPLSTTHFPLSTVHHPLSTAQCPPCPTIHHGPLSTAHCPLPPPPHNCYEHQLKGGTLPPSLSQPNTHDCKPEGGKETPPRSPTHMTGTWEPEGRKKPKGG